VLLDGVNWLEQRVITLTSIVMAFVLGEATIRLLAVQTPAGRTVLDTLLLPPKLERRANPLP
jgi:hypothetical protein